MEGVGGSSANSRFGCSGVRATLDGPRGPAENFEDSARIPAADPEANYRGRPRLPAESGDALPIHETQRTQTRCRDDDFVSNAGRRADGLPALPAAGGGRAVGAARRRNLSALRNAAVGAADAGVDVGVREAIGPRRERRSCGRSRSTWGLAARFHASRGAGILGSTPGTPNRLARFARWSSW